VNSPLGQIGPPGDSRNEYRDAPWGAGVITAVVHLVQARRAGYGGSTAGLVQLSRVCDPHRVGGRLRRQDT
jgi:hypothetical protein